MTVFRRKFLISASSACLLLPKIGWASIESLAPTQKPAGAVLNSPHVLSNKSLIELRNLPPAGRCYICRTNVEAATGQKMVRSKLRGTGVFDHKIFRYENFRKRIKLFDSRNLHFVACGDFAYD